MIDKIEKKIKEFALQIAGVLIGLQLVVGTFMDLWFGLMVLAILYTTLKVKGE